MKKISIDDVIGACLLTFAVIAPIALIIINAFLYSEPQAQTASQTFTVIERTYNWQVVYHNDTKVMYVVSDGTDNRGTFTLLVNPDGSPMIYLGDLGTNTTCT